MPDAEALRAVWLAAAGDGALSGRGLAAAGHEAPRIALEHVALRDVTLVRAIETAASSELELPGRVRLSEQPGPLEVLDSRAGGRVLDPVMLELRGEGGSKGDLLDQFHAATDGRGFGSSPTPARGRPVDRGGGYRRWSTPDELEQRESHSDDPDSQ